MDNQLNLLIENEKQNIINLRRDFHKYAESGWLEFRTTSKIAEFLENNNIKILMGKDIINTDFVMGYPNDFQIETAKKAAIKQGGKLDYIEKTNNYTGVVGILDTGKKGKTIALRFDIDANKIEESKAENHRPFKEGFFSVNQDSAHCCGHDGHMAIGLTCAKILSQMRGKLNGKIIFIFQPAEEGVRGGKAVVKSGILNGVDYFLSGHIGFKALNINEIKVGIGGFLATKKMKVSFNGNSAHAGASPEQGNNAILAAAFATVAMHTMCQDGRGLARVNVGTFDGGTSSNIVAENAEINMEVRGETQEICQDVYEKCVKAIEGAAIMFNVKSKIELCGEAISCESEKSLSDFTQNIAEKLYPQDKIENTCDFGASEDATFYINEVNQNGGKAEYILFGTEIAAPHHNNKFDFNEDVLIKGVNIYTNLVLKLNSKD